MTACLAGVYREYRMVTLSGDHHVPNAYLLAPYSGEPSLRIRLLGDLKKGEEILIAKSALTGPGGVEMPIVCKCSCGLESCQWHDWAGEIVDPGIGPGPYPIIYWSGLVQGYSTLSYLPYTFVVILPQNDIPAPEFDP